MNANSTAGLIITLSLISAISVNNLAYAQQGYATNTVQSTKTASLITIAAPSSSPARVTQQASSQPPQQHLSKVKITSPTKGQQVPVAKDLMISGTSMDNATSNDCKVSVRLNKISPYQPATATGTGGAADYSKWNFVLTSKYTTIKPGQNRITAKYECANNPTLTAFSRVNVTGVAAYSSTGHVVSPPSSPSTLDLNTKQSKSAVPSHTSTVPSNNGNSGTDKIMGSKGKPSENTALTSKADEMKNSILETLKQGLGGTG